jgi:hypothetical protein
MERESPFLVSCILCFKKFLYCAKISCHSFMIFILYFYCWCLISCPKQIGVFHWKWISMLVTVFSEPVNDGHRVSSVLFSLISVFVAPFCSNNLETIFMSKTRRAQIVGASSPAQLRGVRLCLMCVRSPCGTCPRRHSSGAWKLEVAPGFLFFFFLENLFAAG